jgi:predicted amidohydrolase
MKSFRLAMIQMSVVGDEVEVNLSHAVELIGEAARNGAAVAVLPECLDVGWAHPASRELAGEIPGGRAYQALAESASASGILVCAGLTERAGDRIYNSAVVIDSRGKLILLYRKLNEVEAGQPFYARGDRLGVVQTEFGLLGAMICSDAFIEGLVISRTLGQMGAKLILSPCAWAVPPDHDNAKTPYGDEWTRAYVLVAREFGLTIVGVSNVGEMTGGPWQGHRCIGNSLAVGPTGEVLVQAAHGLAAEEIVYLEC